MERVRPITSSAFKHKETGAPLTMQYGRVVGDNGVMSMSPTSQRLRFIGRKIPMPVRSGTWFNGFNFSTMCAWLDEAGYVYEGTVNLGTGILVVAANPVVEYRSELAEKLFNEAVVKLHKEGRFCDAFNVYRYAHNCSMIDAKRGLEQLVNTL